MIDTARWTANEREIVSVALTMYAETLRKRQSRSSSPIVRSDCQWRRVATQMALDAIRER